MSSHLDHTDVTHANTTQHKGLRARESGDTVNLSMTTVGEHEPVRIRFNGTNYNIWLVSTSDTWASDVRMRESSTIKAVRYLTTHNDVGGTHGDWTDGESHQDWGDITWLNDPHLNSTWNNHGNWTDEGSYEHTNITHIITHYNWSDHADDHSNSEPHSDWTNEHNDGVTHTDSHSNWWDHNDWTDYHNDQAHSNSTWNDYANWTDESEPDHTNSESVTHYNWTDETYEYTNWSDHNDWTDGTYTDWENYDDTVP